MTEKEKMLQGDFYNSRDAELMQMNNSAQAFLKTYNALDSDEGAEHDLILKKLLGDKGKGVWIIPPFFCDYGKHISIGDYSFINTNCVFLDNNKISIGNNALIGPHVQIYTANHPVNPSERIRANGKPTYKTNALPITIGDNVWIGGNTVICPGVTIGNNVTIGAGSVVTKDIPDAVLAFGNPCKVQRKLNDKE